MTITVRRMLAEASRHAILLMLAATVFLPFYWMAILSFKSPRDAASGVWYWPQTFSLAGYRQVLAQTPFLQWTLNTLWVAGWLTLGQVTIGFLAAYAFARLKFRGRDTLFFFFLATMMIPHQAIMVPSYVLISLLDWVNTYKGVIIPHLASGYAIFMLRQFLMNVPKELDDAARTDGAGTLRMIWHVYLPLAAPALAALAAILFVTNWNEYYWPLMVLTDRARSTLPVALVYFRDESGIDWVPTMSAAVMATIPTLLLFFVAQRRFIEGFADSGIKG